MIIIKNISRDMFLLFICILFNVALSNNYVASNDRMMKNKLKIMLNKRPWHNLRYYSCCNSEGLRDAMKILEYCVIQPRCERHTYQTPLVRCIFLVIVYFILLALIAFSHFSYFVSLLLYLFVCLPFLLLSYWLSSLFLFWCIIIYTRIQWSK
jgi:hypothetical protein